MLFRVPEHISVELKKDFLRSNQQFVNSNGLFRTQLGLRPLRFRLCSRANTTKVVSTPEVVQYKDKYFPWMFCKSQLCSEQTVWVYEPSIWPQEFFLQFHRNMFRDPKWHSLGRIFICPCADMVLWQCVGIKRIYWFSHGDGLDMSPAFYFFLRGETLKAIISQNHLQWPQNCIQTHTSNNCGKWFLFLLFKPTYSDFTWRPNVLPYNVYINI